MCFISNEYTYSVREYKHTINQVRPGRVYREYIDGSIHQLRNAFNRNDLAIINTYTPISTYHPHPAPDFQTKSLYSRLDILNTNNNNHTFAFKRGKIVLDFSSAPPPCTAPWYLLIAIDIMLIRNLALWFTSLCF